MDNKLKISSLIHNGANITIIGDSLAAGGGSSKIRRIDEVILVDGEEIYVRREAPNSWWGKLKFYLEENYPNCCVTNNGCGGINSSVVRENLNHLYNQKDDIIIILLGTNDRKIENGMEKLHRNLTYIVKYFKALDKQVVLMTPNPSTIKNESYPNRLYHMEDVVKVISDIALCENVLLIDHFCYIQEYLIASGKIIDDIIFGNECSNDGLHPSDEVQELMFYNVLNCLLI